MGNMTLADKLAVHLAHLFAVLFSRDVLSLSRAFLTSTSLFWALLYGGPNQIKLNKQMNDSIH